MPTVTLVGSPDPRSSAYDRRTHTRFHLNSPVDIDDFEAEGLKGRLESLAPLGYEFTFEGVASFPFTEVAPTDPDPAGVATAPIPPAADAASQ